jgi:RHS repeat-associated protein
MAMRSFMTESVACASRYAGKERDIESGLDYFGARYYASNMGRFMSPDWSAKQEPVPYSKLDDPQTLNLYSYVGNNPLSRADKDGHCFPFCLALAGGGVLAEEAPLAFTGPVGWTVIGLTAVGVAGVAAYQYFHQDAPAATPAPAAPTGATPVPTGLVGTDPTPTKGRTNSGPLAPGNGGTGDAGKDFGTLTGGKSGPAPPGSTLPPGTQVGENGTQLRPGSPTSGPRIDIPANGPKPIETLHYPAPPAPPAPPPTPVVKP